VVLTTHEDVEKVLRSEVAFVTNFLIQLVRAASA